MVLRKKFLNEQGKILPRRITGTSLKYQRRVAQAVKEIPLRIIFFYGGALLAIMSIIPWRELSAASLLERL